MYDLSELNDEAVLRGFALLLHRRSETAAAVLAHIAEIDARHLYLREGFESMKAYCMKRLELTEDAAAKRLQLARIARQMPQLFPAIAERKLSLYAVRILAGRLNPSNVESLIAACAHKSGEEIERLLAARYPQAEPLRLDEGISTQSISQDATGRSAQLAAAQQKNAIPDAARHSGLPEALPPMAHTALPKVRTRLEPISATRYTLQVTLSEATHDKLRRLQDLLAHAIPNRDVSEVIDRSFDALIDRIERRRFGANARGYGKRPAPQVRTIPAQIKKAVYQRDRAACTHRFEDGRTCRSRWKLEFDHIVPVAKGGRTTLENVRLLCRAHNQAAAEAEFGLEHVERKKNERRSLQLSP
jgi:hypothetical protein